MIPILFFVAVMSPAVVLAALTGLFGDIFADFANLPGPADYYGIVSPILFIFAAIIAPELLCPDRRDGVITLYLVRPITTTDYVLSRWSAFFIVSLVFIYSGQFLLIAGLVLGSAEPVEYLRNNWLDVPRSLGGGLAIALVTTTIPLAAASLTDRRAYASVAVIGLFLVSTATSEILTATECTTVTESSGAESVSSGSRTQVTVTIGESTEERVPNMECRGQLGEYAKWASLVDLGNIQINVSDMIFGTYDDADEPPGLELLPWGIVVAWYVLVVTIPGFVLWVRYWRLSR